MKTAIDYDLIHTTLGPVLLAATAKGVCFAGFGDEHTLEQDLMKRFSECSFNKNNKNIEQYSKVFSEHIDNNTPFPELPISLSGTAFQQQVWRTLMTIPAGETRSYQDVAMLIDRPKAFRAVAGACAQNPIALVIPCHRIVRRDGGLSGYYWGIERKQALLARETGRYPYPDAFSSFRQSTTHTS